MLDINCFAVSLLLYCVFNATLLLKNSLQSSWGLLSHPKQLRSCWKASLSLSVGSTRWGNTEQTECGKETILMMAIINEACHSVRHSNTTTMGRKWFRTAEVWGEHTGLLWGFLKKGPRVRKEGIGGDRRGGEARRENFGGSGKRDFL